MPPAEPPERPLPPNRIRAALEVEAARREPPSFTGTVGATGGLLAAAGVLVLVGELPDDSTRGLGILISAALLAAGVAARYLSPTSALGKAGIAAVAVAVPPLVFLLVTGTDEVPTRSDYTIVLLVAALLYGVLYLFGPTRAATALLALGLVAVWQMALVQTVPDTPFGPAAPFVLGPEIGFDEDSSSFQEVPQDSLPDDFTDPSIFDFDEDFAEENFGDESTQIGGGSSDEFEPEELGIISLLIGALFVFAAWALDRRPLQAAATAFFLVGDLALTVGVLAIGAGTNAAAGGVLALGVGATLALLGADSGRRFTAWLGGLGVLGGLVTIVAEIVEDDGTAAGLMLLAVGVAVALGAQVLAPRVGEGGSPPPAAPPPSPATPPPVPAP